MDPPPEQPNITIELDDRLYLAPRSSVPMVSYVLAVDSDARQSDDEMHRSLRAMVGANYCGPVQDVLTFSSTNEAIVVDIGSASGQWIVEMASEFPLANFYGIDLFPTHRDDLPRNAQILSFNFHEHWPFEDGTVDMVHMRQLQYATSSTNYKNLLREASRVLRSDGLLITAESSRTYLNNENTVLDMTQMIPMSQKHRETMFALIRENGLDWSGEGLSTMITETMTMAQPESVVIAIPIGQPRQPMNEARPISDIASKMVERMLDILSSFRPHYKAQGGTDEEWDDAIVDCERDAMAWPNVAFPFYIVWARKR